MKRLLTLTVVLMVVLSAACWAAAEEKTFRTAYFTIALPNGWDFSTDEAEEIEEDTEFLGYFFEEKDIGLVAAAYIVYYEEFKDTSLWNATKAEMQDYIDTVLYDYEDDDPEYLGSVTAGNIPFVLFSAADEDGDYLHAETMTNGHAIVFQAYVMGEDGETQYPMTEKYIEQFKSILTTFLPVS